MHVRRNARVAVEVLVAVDGIDAHPVARKGNISASGIYFVSEQDMDAVGTVTWLTITSDDRARSVTVMAYVVRRVSLTDIRGRRAVGVAFEFMPETEEAATEVSAFVRHILTVRRERASQEHAAAAPGRRMVIRALALETTWAVAPGDQVYVDVFVPGMGKVSVAARAADVLRISNDPTDPHYAIDLAVVDETRVGAGPRPEVAAAGPGGSAPRPASVIDDEESSRSIDELLSALVTSDAPPAGSSRRQTLRTGLSGMFSRVPFTTLCSLFDMDRMTGRLVVQPPPGGGGDVFVYVKGGQLIDVEPLPSGMSPRERLMSLFSWTEGGFHFYVEPVDRPDRVGLGTTQLLLEGARLADEKRGRGAASA